MLAKKATFSIIKGMRQDFSEATFNGNAELEGGVYAYENYNMRLTPNKDNTLWSISNERGPLDLNITLKGSPVGDCKANDKWVIFTVDNNGITYIYVLSNLDSIISINLLFSGNLYMSLNKTIHTKFFYENKDLLKIYWIDGINLCRFINIAASEEEKYKWKIRKNPFDFVPELDLNENIKITKNHDASGHFDPGVLLYFLTYLNLYGQESNIFYASPLLYTSLQDRAGAFSTNGDSTSNAICNNSFTIQMKNILKEYDYVNIYSILRTSLDNEVLAKQVAQLKISNSALYKNVPEKSEAIYYSIETTQLNYLLEDAIFKSISSIKNLSLVQLFGKTHLRDDAFQYEKLEYNIDENIVILDNNKYAEFVLIVENPFSAEFSAGLAYDVMEDKHMSICFVLKAEYKANLVFIYDNKNKLYTIEFKSSVDNTAVSVQGSELYNLSTIVIKEDYTENAEYTSLIFTDTNTTGKNIAPTDLFFVGGTPISAETFDQKDNTLFLGNIKTELFSSRLSNTLKDVVLNSVVGENNLFNLKFELNKQVETPCTGEYPYKSQLDLNSYEYKLFKYKEYYRLGLQFQNKYGIWSDVVYLKDLQNNIKLLSSIQEVLIANSTNKLLLASIPYTKWASPVLSVDSNVLEDNKKVLDIIELITALELEGYKKVRPVIVYPEYYDSEFVMLGIVSPTVYSLYHRYNNEPYSQASWFFRPNPGYDINLNLSIDTGNSYMLSFDVHIYPLNKTDVSRFDYLVASYEEREAYFDVELNEVGSTNVQSFALVRSTVYILHITSTDFDRDDNGDEIYEIVFHIDNYISGLKSLTAIDLLYYESRAPHRCANSKVTNVYCVNSNLTVEANEDIFSISKTNNLFRPETGRFILFKHNQSIPGTSGYTQHKGKVTDLKELALLSAMAELQPIDYSLESFSEVTNDDIEIYRDNYFVDLSLVTFNSPEIIANIFYKNINTDNFKFRIVGIAPLTSASSNTYILAEGPATTLFFKELFVNYGEAPKGFIKNTIKYNNSFLGGRIHVNCADWQDEVSYRGCDIKKYTKLANGNSNLSPTCFVTYPWLNGGSLSNSKNRTSFQNNLDKENEAIKLAAQFPTMTGKLKLHITSNMRISAGTYYFSEDKIDCNLYKDADIKLWNSLNQTLIQISDKLNGSNDNIDLNYYGNIDTIVNHNTNEINYNLMVASTDLNSYNSELYYPLSELLSKNNQESKNYRSRVGFLNYDLNGNTDDLFGLNILESGDEANKDIGGKEGAHMRYKSTPHYLLNLSYNNRGLTLPRIKISKATADTLKLTLLEYNIINSKIKTKYPNSTIDNLEKESIKSNIKLNNVRLGTTYDYATIPEIDFDNIVNPYAYLWVGELYRDNVNNRFGGTHEGALADNIWLSCGNGLSLASIKDAINNKTAFKLIWEEGDTYYLRYDCLKTYPYTTSDLNLIYETVSFMCESKTNLDGRYDINRKNYNTFTQQPAVNYNLFNPVYSQKNNFFTFLYYSKYTINTEQMPNAIVWTSTKLPGKFKDDWSTFNFASSLDLDGDKGAVNYIGKVNNDLYCILDHAISKILYNEHVQIATESNIPVQLANSGKVDGKVYISETVGCLNPLAIVKAEDSIFFVDNSEHAMYALGKESLEGLLFNISTSTQMSTFFKNHFISKLLYDSYLKDVYSIYDTNLNKESINNENSTTIAPNKIVLGQVNKPLQILDFKLQLALAYNCLLGAFSSIYNYGKAINMSTVMGIPFTYIKTQQNGNFTTSIYKLYAGDYGNYFGNIYPYYTTFIVNPASINDKIYTNIEYVSNTWDNAKILDTLMFLEMIVWNEYQKGQVLLKDHHNHPSALKQKFRIWRANIPRHTLEHNGNKPNLRARIRSPWMYLKLKGTLLKKSDLLNLNVIYYI